MTITSAEKIMLTSKASEEWIDTRMAARAQEHDDGKKSYRVVTSPRGDFQCDHYGVHKTLENDYEYSWDVFLITDRNGIDMVVVLDEMLGCRVYNLREAPLTASRMNEEAAVDAVELFRGLSKQIRTPT